MATNPKRSVEDNRTKEKSTSSEQDSMSAVELLEEDHREVESLFEEYQSLEQDSAKEALALKICMMLQVHAQLEEEIFYPEARNAITKPELIDEAIVEHASAKQLIGEIEHRVSLLAQQQQFAVVTALFTGHAVYGWEDAVPGLGYRLSPRQG